MLQCLNGQCLVWRDLGQQQCVPWKEGARTKDQEVKLSDHYKTSETSMGSPREKSGETRAAAALDTSRGASPTGVMLNVSLVCLLGLQAQQALGWLPHFPIQSEKRARGSGQLPASQKPVRHKG